MIVIECRWQEGKWSCTSPTASLTQHPIWSRSDITHSFRSSAQDRVPLSRI